jgi:hypothetical protein
MKSKHSCIDYYWISGVELVLLKDSIPDNRWEDRIKMLDKVEKNQYIGELNDTKHKKIDIVYKTRKKNVDKAVLELEDLINALTPHMDDPLAESVLTALHTIKKKLKGGE